MADANSNALRRIETLLDPGSFVEIGASITARATDFNKNPAQEENDGVITGQGLVDGNLVFVYSQDANTLGGSLGEMHAKKICALYDLAKKVGAPVVGMFDSKGIRLMESVDAAESLGCVIGKMASASGVIPMISAVFGELGGGMAALASLSDFTFMEEKAHLFITPPDGVEGVNKDKDDISDAKNQYRNTGVIDAIASSDEILAKIRELITLIPSSSMEEGRVEAPLDDMNRVLDSNIKEADTESFVSALADNGVVFHAKNGFAHNIYTGIIRMGGRTVGVVANRRDEKGNGGYLCGKCTKKAARFVKFLDAFDIPVLTITDVAGFGNKIPSENDLPLALSELAVALANADCGKINLIRSAKSSAYIFMNSKSLSADLVYAYPDSKLEIMDVDILAKAIASSSDESVDEIKAKLQSEIYGAKNAARRGYVDSLIDFAETRKYLIAGFDMLETKTVLSYKKHEAR